MVAKEVEMNKKWFVVPALLVLILSACGGQSATETAAVTATEAAGATALVSLTEAPVTTEVPATTGPDTAATAAASTPLTVTATVGTQQPANPADCTNSA